MTEPQHPAPVAITPEPGGRLDHLLGLFDQTKAEADDVNKRLDVIKNAIKAELSEAATDALDITASSASGVSLRMYYVEAWRVDSKRLKQEEPQTYERFAKKSGAWRLEQIQSSDPT